jgi:predicted dinucleotide-binding enzyme
MNIGILGTNERAVAIGRLLASGGHDLTFSDVSDGTSAERAAGTIGAQAETPYHQAMTRDLIVFACDRTEVDPAIAAFGTGPNCIVVDALDGGPERSHRGAELLARKLDSHEVVRALIVLPQTGANVPICGDDPEAKKIVTEMLEACGCLTSDHGPLSKAPELEPISRPIAA